MKGRSELGTCPGLSVQYSLHSFTEGPEGQGQCRVVVRAVRSAADLAQVEVRIPAPASFVTGRVTVLYNTLAPNSVV